jgi:hypothetical protein
MTAGLPLWRPAPARQLSRRDTLALRGDVIVGPAVAIEGRGATAELLPALYDDVAVSS